MQSPKTIAIIGTLDSKGIEHQFLADTIKALGHKTLLIDLGSGSEPQIKVDITRHQVAKAANLNLQPILDRQDRGECIAAIAKAAPAILKKLLASESIHAVISLGGGGGTALATSAMKELPLGIPKIMVSTLASGNTAHYIGTSDITMIPAIVDITGLNSISKTIFTQAAHAICGMAEASPNLTNTKPIIVASMFGNTTECINTAKEILENAGYEVLVFHATGTGGKTMEALIESGMVKGILDITTTEWADELVGATLSAGPTRMDAMTTAAIPAVIAPGCLDMANFGEPHTIPDHFASRTLYHHNPQVTLMRTNAQECAELGKIIAQKANANPAPTAILNPLKTVSIISAKGQPFHDPDADSALFNAIHQHATVPVIDYNEEINSHTFAKAAALKLLELIKISNQ